jgi:hypothetical protein
MEEPFSLKSRFFQKVQVKEKHVEKVAEYDEWLKLDEKGLQELVATMTNEADAK